jgi:hypothetical protein
MKKLILAAGLLFSALTFAQGAPDYAGGLKVNINEDGSKYFRIISWAQVWAQYNGDKPLDANGNEQSEIDFSVRRARVLLYSQISPKFLIVTHFGLNSLNGNNMSPTGTGDNSQLFMHDAYVQYNLGTTNKHAIGGGLHYWNGISRMNNSSTLNILTLDNFRQGWATLGLADQFARPVGVFAKGAFGKLQYRVSINDALTNNLGATSTQPVAGDPISYGGRKWLGGKKAGKTFSGYFDYNFLDQESQFLPYKVGTYLGDKKVFNVGAGFFSHPNGSVVADVNGNLSGENVSIFAVDAFYDAPIGKGSAITAYAMYQNSDYGKDFRLGTTYETGSILYGHVGYVIPTEKETKLQPYVSFANRQIDALDDNATQFGIGANLFLKGHHSKLTLEYQNLKYASADAVGTVTLQAMIYL